MTDFKIFNEKNRVGAGRQVTNKLTSRLNILLIGVININALLFLLLCLGSGLALGAQVVIINNLNIITNM